jgi:hypothetical protein
MTYVQPALFPRLAALVLIHSVDAWQESFELDDPGVLKTRFEPGIK